MTFARNDRGGVIVGYFTKIAVVLGLFGLVSFDAVSVGVAKMNAADTATQAAQTGAEEWTNSHNRTLAFQAAEEFAQEHHGTLDPKTFRIDPDGTVWVRLDQDATTLLLYRTSKTRTWAHVTATGHGKAL